jgi:hypothetical protein
LSQSASIIVSKTASSWKRVVKISFVLFKISSKENHFLIKKNKSTASFHFFLYIIANIFIAAKSSKEGV